MIRFARRGRGWSVNHFERSSGLDTALYIKINLYLLNAQLELRVMKFYMNGINSRNRTFRFLSNHACISTIGKNINYIMWKYDIPPKMCRGTYVAVNKLITKWYNNLLINLRSPRDCRVRAWGRGRSRLYVLDRKLLERLMSPSPKSQVMFASAFSWIGDFFEFLGFIFFKLWRVRWI